MNNTFKSGIIYWMNFRHGIKYFTIEKKSIRYFKLLLELVNILAYMSILNYKVFTLNTQTKYMKVRI